MKNILCLLILICSSATLLANNKIRETIDTADRIAKKDTEAAQALLNEVKNQYDQLSDEDKAVFGVSYLRVCNMQEIEAEATYIDFSLQYLKNKNVDNNLAKCYLQLGYMHIIQRKYPEAINNLLKGIDVCDKKDNYAQGNLYAALGLVSSYQLEMEVSLNYYDQAVKAYQRGGFTDDVAQTKRNVGMIYMYLDNYDWAMQYYKEAISISNDSTLLGDTYEEMSNVYNLLEQNDSALFYAQKSLDYPYYSTNGTKRLYHVAMAYYDMEMYDSAKVYCQQVLDGYSDIYIDGQCLQMLINIENLEGNPEEALEYTRMYKQTLDSISIIESQANVKDVEKMHQMEKEQATAKAHRRNIIIISAILILILGVCAFYFFRKTKHQKKHTEDYKNKLQETEEQNKLHQMGLLQKQESLIDKLNQELQQTRSRYQEEWKDANFLQREAITLRIYKEVLLFESPNEFINKMNIILNGVPNKLQAEYPNINYNDILWSCLFLLDIQTNDICLIMNYKPTSLYKLKQRLYKKIGFESAKDLEQMLQSKLYAL